MHVAINYEILQCMLCKMNAHTMHIYGTCEKIRTCIHHFARGLFTEAQLRQGQTKGSLLSTDS
jgi:hypothetical protein